MEINRINKTVNPVPYNKKEIPVTYDNVRVYCRYCQEKIDLRVYHALGKFETFQIVNLPEHLADHLDSRQIECTHCDKNFLIERNVRNKKTEFFFKLDCSKMVSGMESWYEDAIPNMSKEEYR